MKPGFFKNEQLAELSPWHRLCFQGLWGCADREGRLQDRPRRLKAEIFPYDDLDVNQLLWDLMRAGFIVRYQSGGHPYVWIPSWSQHQHPRADEADSTFPPYEQGQERTASDPTTFPAARHLQIVVTTDVTDIDTEPHLSSDDAVSPPRMGQLDLGRGTSGSGSAAAPRRQAREPFRAQDLMELWNATTKPPIPRCQELTNERRQKIRTRIAKRPSLAEWREAFEAIDQNPYCKGENDRRWMATFDWIIRSDTQVTSVLERARAKHVTAGVRGCFHAPPCATPAEHTKRQQAEALGA